MNLYRQLYAGGRVPKQLAGPFLAEEANERYLSSVLLERIFRRGQISWQSFIAGAVRIEFTASGTYTASDMGVALSRSGNKLNDAGASFNPPECGAVTTSLESTPANTEHQLAASTAT
jgi:hypothetical protein